MGASKRGGGCCFSSRCIAVKLSDKADLWGYESSLVDDGLVAASELGVVSEQRRRWFDVKGSVSSLLEVEAVAEQVEAASSAS